MSDTEDILKNQLKDGNIDAFKTIFEAFYNQLLDYSTSITADRESSRELVQDVYAKIWENRHTSGISGSIKSYLFTAVYHHSLNWLRHKKIEREYHNNKLKLLSEEFELAPLVNPFQKDAVEKALFNLPEKAREIFFLFYIDGLPQKEISSKLGINIKTIENQLLRSKKILRRKLKAYR